LAARNLSSEDGALVVLYCTTPKNGILIAAPTGKMKNFEMEYSVKSPPSLPSRLDDTQLNWSVTADDDDHVHSSDVSRKRSYRARLGSRTMTAVTIMVGGAHLPEIDLSSLIASPLSPAVSLKGCAVATSNMRVAPWPRGEHDNG
jgi:hypothetical protein